MSYDLTASNPNSLPNHGHKESNRFITVSKSSNKNRSIYLCFSVYFTGRGLHQSRNTFRTISNGNHFKPSEARWSLGGKLKLETFKLKLKGKSHANLLPFQNPKCLSVSKKNKIIVKFVINYHLSAIKLSISASGQRQSRPVWIET